MSRLADAFDDGPAFVPYLVVGDPSLDASRAYVEALAAGGADVVELGLPFSEPMAEGPTIQSAVTRALDAGTTPARFFEFVESLDVDVPLVCMTYYNLVYQFGDEEGPRPFVERAAAAGIDGFVIPDLPAEESGPLREACAASGLDLVFIVAPTTADERLERIREAASGYVYVQARLGTTGARRSLSTRTEESLERLADWDVPRAVGFGISTPEQARRVVAAGADGVIVGSALVDRIAEGVERGESTEQVAAALEERVRELVRGVREGARRRGVDPSVRAILDAADERTGEGRVDVDARSFEAAFAAAEADGRVPIIAELKPTSPTTDGTRAFDPAAVARELVAGGASALSVLTEPTAFGGSPDLLRRAREAVDVPVLRKDFLLREDHLDVVEADAVLLIARFVDDLPGMVAAARDRGMEPLVEVHTRAELERALDAGATLVGVNNRDLTSLDVDLSTFERVAPSAPDDVTLVAESGVSGPDDVRRLREAGADALLVGSAIMAGDARETTASLVRAETTNRAE